ncbi:threonine transporter RhtB [Rhizobium laguerreae]|uniref:threonine transporter RhtB n=1 Tax=Rhizobium laguerreae TaxID=1076926 RepID=UPI001C92A706|nr:threonine transporter RhtB [Rhizobium laguerreae]MBY3102322.1 threonine transporter RhtB [Rhizobium laguerreae]
MEHLAFASASFALLLLPGPTNAMLALSATELSTIRTPLRVGTVVVGYLATIVGVANIAGPLLQDHVAVERIAKLASAFWVLYLGFRLWAPVQSSEKSLIGNVRLLVTTLLNPKGVVLGLTMIPPSQNLSPSAAIATIAVVVTVTSCLWLLAGRLLLVGSRRVAVARKAGSAILLLFSALLASSALS